MFRADDERPILVDLGLVRDLSSSSLTQDWAPRGPGTPFYSSPEQLNNDKRLISWKSDQFSLGVVVSVCLTGKHPYQWGFNNERDAVIAVAQRKPVPESFKTQMTEQDFGFLASMVEPWPIRRIQTTENLIRVFQK
jgi:serine/threonine protein kinase